MKLLARASRSCTFQLVFEFLCVHERDARTSGETVDEQKLIEIAKALDVSVEAIKNFSEEAVFNIIGNTFQDQSAVYNCNCTFNPLDKVVELYERLVQAEKDKVEYLEKLLNGK